DGLKRREGRADVAHAMRRALLAVCPWPSRRLNSLSAMRLAVCAATLSFLLAVVPASADTLQANGMRLVKLGDFASPVAVTAPPGDPRRAFVVEKGSGGTAHIRVIRDGVALAQPFLTLTAVATDGPSGEQGLLSMAFAPDYATSGRFYLYFTDGNGCSPDGCDIRVDEYARATEDTAGAFQRTLFTVGHRAADNHNGGQVAFGPDGLLYAGIGDRGGAGDLPCDSQNPASRLGKVLRVDTSQPGALTPQVYALGVRNPFRFSFDRFTGDL